MLIATRGLPGAGKTTWARGWVAEDPEHRARINRDDLRAMMHGGLYLPPVDYAPGTERVVLAVRDAAVVALLLAGRDVVYDDPNLTDEHVEQVQQLATMAGSAVVRWHDLRHVDIDTCVARDRARARPVGETVIRQMHAEHIAADAAPAP